MGFDFDPLETVLELENENSKFWNAIKGCQHSYLWGLLYGFGEDNSWGYFWKGRNRINMQKHEKEISFSHALKKACFFDL